MGGVIMISVDGGGAAKGFRPDRKRRVPLRVLGQPRRADSLRQVRLRNTAASGLADGAKSASGSHTPRLAHPRPERPVLAIGLLSGEYPYEVTKW